jgi:hypothetical protein
MRWGGHFLGKLVRRRSYRATKSLSSALVLEPLEPRTLLSTYHFDFGGAGSPVATGYTGVPLTAYTSSQGYGWATLSNMNWVDRNTGNPLLTDFHYGVDNTFIVDLPNGVYDITPSMGDALYTHQVALSAQGQQLASNITTAPGQYVNPTYRVQISNGQLNFRITTVGGYGSTFVLNGLDINYGYGVFEHMNYQQMVARPGAHLTAPEIAGAEFHLPWAELEPTKGQYRFSKLDSLVALWGGAGKKITFVVKTSPSGTDTDPWSGSPTPAWVFAEGAKSLTVNEQGMMQQVPLLWDPVFLQEYQTFVQQLGARYDGNPGIEFVIVGPGVFGTTRAIYPANALQWKAAGYTDQLWYQTQVTIMGFYQSAFHMTHLCLGMAPFINSRIQNATYSEFTLAQYAAQQGMYVYYHNLYGNSTWNNSQYPQFFASLGSSTKIALGMDNPTSTSETIENTYGDPVNCVENAFGGGSTGLPVIHTYYLVFYLYDIDAAYPGSTFQQEYYDALAVALADMQQTDNGGGGPCPGCV